MYAVEEVDYPALVADMAAAGLPDMGKVLSAKIVKIGRPKWRNEIRYFWASLFNAAKANDIVWLWLCTAPHIRHFAPAEALVHISPEFVSDIPLPDIGSPDDEPYQDPVVRPRQYPAEPTEENFIKQTKVLEVRLRDEGLTIEEYVETFYYSGSGQIVAQVQLAEEGFHALATREGINWLMATYPPAR